MTQAFGLFLVPFHLGQQLSAPEPALHPSRKKIIQVLQLGVLVNLAAMLLTLVSIETIVGGLLLKTLSKPFDGKVLQTSLSNVEEANLKAALAKVQTEQEVHAA
ncbi:MAG: DUF3611 family protein [Nostoc sp.]|uniref:DUF3611 family protein n=1 Tax=Nostoc sp. TaxID=1180 RepID=UPI002FFAF865